MLIGIHFGEGFGLVDFTSKGGKVCFIFWKYVLSLARLALSLSEAGSAWYSKAMSLILVPRKWILSEYSGLMTVSLV